MDDGDEQALAQFYAPDVAESLKLTNKRCEMTAFSDRALQSG